MLWADDAPHPDTIDALAEALRADPVVVQETHGSGDASGAYDRLSDLVRRMPFKAYVALVDAPDEVADGGVDASGYLATALSRRIGEPGLYVVGAGDTPLDMRLVGVGWDETVFHNQYFTDTRLVEKRSGSIVLAPTVAAEVAVRAALAGRPEGYGTPNLSDPAVSDLVARERELQPYERPSSDEEPPEPWTAGKRWMVGTTVGVGALVLYLQTLRGWPGWRRRPPRRRPARPGSAERLVPPRLLPPDPDALRREAEAELTRLAEELPAAPSGPHLDRAALARETAEPLLASEDVLDVVGALVLARTGRRDVTRARGRARTPYRPCFFDPRHGAGTRTAEWEFGDASVTVPVCRRCARALDTGGAPAPLSVRRLGRLQPYYEGRSVWARTGFGSLVDDLADEVAAERGSTR